MATKRMFNLNVVDTDNFLEMPISSRLLYYELGMRADDDGFVDNWKKILLFTGLKQDDMKVLISKKFIIPFESGVIVIRHWRLNNYLQNDRIKPTIYQEELNKLDVDDNNVYAMDTKCIHRREETRRAENSINTIYAHFEQFWKAYPKKVSKQKCLKWFESNKPNEQLLKIMLEQLEKFKQTKEWQKDNGQFIPYPDTWLRNKRWEDEIIVDKNVPIWFNKEHQQEIATEDEQKEMDDLLKDFRR
ncbi:MAG: phage replication initiation protein [Bacilli bacterium]|nr:phage replication initiation protein [Bacilli bacterium]